MANKLIIENIVIDEFFKSLMFQEIMDIDLPRNERDTLLVVFRSTLHFDKWSDKIAMYWLSKKIGIGENTLRITLDRLESKSLVDISRSKGGKTKSVNRFNSFSLNSYLVDKVFRKWQEIKIDDGYDFIYDD